MRAAPRNAYEVDGSKLRALPKDTAVLPCPVLPGEARTATPIFRGDEEVVVPGLWSTAAAGRAARCSFSCGRRPFLGRKSSLGSSTIRPAPGSTPSTSTGDVAVGGQLHFGRLHVGRSILRLETRLNDGAVAGLVYRKVSSPPDDLLKMPKERSRLSYLPVFFSLSGHGAAIATAAKKGRNRANHR